MNKKNNKKGFTLAELLIVVAIIAVLVAISIVIFTAQLEKAREATDLANVRAAYAEVMVAAMEEDTDAKYTMDNKVLHQNDGSYQAVVKLEQKQNDWQTSKSNLEIGGIIYTDSIHWVGTPRANGECKVVYQNDSIYFYWSGGTTSGNPGSETTDPVTPVNPTNKDETTGMNGGVKELKTNKAINLNKGHGYDVKPGILYRYDEKYYIGIDNDNASEVFDNHECFCVPFDPSTTPMIPDDFKEGPIAVEFGQIYVNENNEVYVMTEIPNGKTYNSPDNDGTGWLRVENI